MAEPTITRIVVLSDAEGMLDDWTGIDREASVARYDEGLRAAFAEAWPDAVVKIVHGLGCSEVHAYTMAVLDEDARGRRGTKRVEVEAEATSDAVGRLVQMIYEDFVDGWCVYEAKS